MTETECVPTTRDGFEKALAGKPDDKALMLVYADWLDEHGEADEALAYRLAATAPWPGDGETLSRLLGLPGDTVQMATAGHAGAGVPDRPHWGQPREPVAYARQVVAWARQHAAALGRAAAHLRRQEAFAAAAREGDVDAQLALPGARDGLRQLVNGKRPAGRVTDVCPSRRAVAEAKARIAERERRREARREVEEALDGDRGRVRRAWIDKLRRLAAEMGERYHRTVRPLYRSKYGEVLYGRGGQETVDRDRYSKGWHGSHGAARNLNGGARLDDEDKPTCVVLENHLGNEVARLPLKGEG